MREDSLPGFSDITKTEIADQLAANDLNIMKISDWEGVALIIGSGDIGRSISDYLATESPNSK